VCLRARSADDHYDNDYDYDYDARSHHDHDDNRDHHSDRSDDAECV
jgi:hypothetical protein